MLRIHKISRSLHLLMLIAHILHFAMFVTAIYYAINPPKISILILLVLLFLLGFLLVFRVIEMQRDKDGLFDQQNALAQSQKENLNLNLIINRIIEISTTDKSRLINSSDEICVDSQYSPKGQVRQSYQSLYSSSYLSNFFKSLWDVLVKGKAWIGVIINIPRNGKTYLANSKVIPLLNINGIPFRNFSITQDNEKGFELRNSIEASEIKYRRLFEAAFDGILILDIDTDKITDVNPYMIRMLGYTKEEFLDKELWEIGLFKDVEESKEAFRQLKILEYITYDNLPLISKDGRRFNVEFVSNVYFENKEKVIQCNIRDITDRIISAEALKISESNLKAIFEYSVEGFLLTDSEGFIKSFNKNALELIFKNPEHEVVIGKNICEFIVDSEKENYINISLKVLAGETIEYDNSYQNINGETRWVNWTISPVLVGGSVKEICITALDYTEKRINEQNLIKSELRFRDYFENAAEAITEVNIETGLFIKHNNNAVNLLKYKSEELLAKSPIEISPEYQPDGRRSSDIVLEMIGATLKGNKPVFEWVIIDGQGNDLTVELRLSKLISDKNKSILISFVDITERKKAREELVEREQQLRVFVENSPAALAMLDTNMKYIITSDQWKTDYRIGKIDIIGKSHYEVFPEITDEWREILKRCLAGAVEKRSEDLFIRENGEEDWVRWEIHPWYKYAGEVGGIIMLTEVINERKEVEAKLEKQNLELKKTNSELDRFVYSTSHDLRSPLTSILGLINIVDDGLEPNQNDLRGLTGMMKKSIEKLDTFISDILIYSRNARTELEMSEIDFEEIIDESKKNLKYMEGANSNDIVIDINQKGKFMSDQGRISIMMNNLISNAIKYMDSTKENPFVKINVISDDVNAIIVVEDNGIGIEAKDHERIFEMFYRGTKKSSGSGLGMYILKETIDKLEGSITVESNLNIGSTFKLTVPNVTLSDL